MAETGETSEGDGDREEERASFREIAREVGLMLGVAFTLVATVSVGAQFVPWGSQYVYLLVAAVFYGLPFLWIERNGWDFRRFGLVADRIWSTLGWGLGFAVLTAVPFAGGYWVWETYAVGSTYEFEWDNYRKWDPQLQGEPEGWGEAPGVWVWLEDRSIRAGLRAGDPGEPPLTVRLKGDRAFSVDSVGDAFVEPVEGTVREGDEVRAERWRVTVRGAQRRAELSIAPSDPGMSRFPRSLELSVTEGSRAHPIRAGPGADRVDGSRFTVNRGLSWIYLWLLTQLLLIAYPEEFFYRGYVQTRVGEAIEAYRSEQNEGAGESRSWFGVSEENLVASAAFGLGHLLTPVGGRILWNRAAVAFPSVVFGWLRDRTGTIGAAVAYHTACNMMVLLAEPHFF